MKGLVTEIRDGKAAVLREDGVFVSVRKNCKVGDTIEVPAEVVSFPVRRVAAAAAALVVMFGAGGYSYMNVQACSYVSLDVNPSVEYVLNRKDLVISAEGLNEDGKALVEELNALGIKGNTLSEALEKTASLLPEDADADAEDYVLLNVTSDSDDHADRLSEEAKGVFEKEQKHHRTVACSRASKKSRKHARELGISTGRYEEMLGMEKDPEAFKKHAPEYRDMELGELFTRSGRIGKHPGDMPGKGPEDKPGEPNEPDKMPPVGGPGGKPAGPEPGKDPGGEPEKPPMDGGHDGGDHGGGPPR